MKHPISIILGFATLLPPQITPSHVQSHLTFLKGPSSPGLLLLGFLINPRQGPSSPVKVGQAWSNQKHGGGGVACTNLAQLDQAFAAIREIRVQPRKS